VGLHKVVEEAEEESYWQVGTPASRLLTVRLVLPGAGVLNGALVLNPVGELPRALPPGLGGVF
jgi:hypothetical protein